MGVHMDNPDSPSQDPKRSCASTLSTHIVAALLGGGITALLFLLFFSESPEELPAKEYEVATILRLGADTHDRRNMPQAIVELSHLANSTKSPEVALAATKLLLAANSAPEAAAALNSAVDRGLLPPSAATKSPTAQHGGCMFPQGAQEEVYKNLAFNADCPVAVLAVGSKLAATDTISANRYVKTATMLSRATETTIISRVAEALMVAENRKLSAESVRPRRLPTDLAVAAFVNLKEGEGFGPRAGFCLKQLLALVSPTTFQAIIRLPAFVPYHNKETMKQFLGARSGGIPPLE